MVGLMEFLVDLIPLVFLGAISLVICLIWLMVRPPRWKHRNWRVRLAAVESLTNQAHLATIAQTDSRSEVLMAAADKLADAKLADATYRKIAMKYDNTCLSVIEAALGKLSIQAIVEVIESPSVKQHYESDEDIERKRKLQKLMKIAAIEKVSDQDYLAQIATWDPGRYWFDGTCNDLRRAAAKKLTDRTVAKAAYLEIDKYDSRVRRQREIERKKHDQILSAEREANCHHDYLMDPEGFCNSCKSLTHTGTCRTCGYVLPHTCT